MKRILSVILSLLMVLFLIPILPIEDAQASVALGAAAKSQVSLLGQAVPIKGESQDLEVLRGIDYGFVPEKLQSDYDRTITFAQYCTMLSNMINLWDASRLAPWKEIANQALASDSEMRRDGGMLAIYEAACVMGKGAEIHEDWNDVGRRCGDGIWNELITDYPQFSNINKPSPFEDIPGRCPGWNYSTSSYFYALGSCSKVNGKALFDCDEKNATMRVEGAFTRAEAIRSIVRLYESDEKNAFRILDTKDTDWSAPLLSNAAARKTEILNSKSKIVKSNEFIQGQTYTGVAYYISNSGNDKNDGKSPDSAWATLENVNGPNSKLAAGDAVFFERGGRWYAHNITPRFDNITYSAYGEGAKPVISGSEPNMADNKKWTLYKEGSNGVKIWVYYRKVSDVSGILFHNNTSWADKAFASWDGTNFVSEDGGKLDVSELLDHDMMFFSAIDLTGHVVNTYVEDNCTGPLYLRCDKGNPGDIYDNIDMIPRGANFDIESNGGTIDNISILYASLGVNCGTNNSPAKPGTLVQNCEFGWCGGNVTSYNSMDGGNKTLQHPFMSGAALLMWGCNHSAINNYFHDCDNKVFNIVILEKETVPTENITMRGNILDHNGAALHLCYYTEDKFPDYTMKNICFEDNDVLYTGYGWFTKKQLTKYSDRGTLCVFDTSYCHNRSSNVNISNNLFYIAQQDIIHSRYMWDKYRPVYFGNTYVQSEGKAFIYSMQQTSESSLYAGGELSDTEAQLKKILGDTNASAIVVSGTRPASAKDTATDKKSDTESNEKSVPVEKIEQKNETKSTSGNDEVANAKDSNVPALNTPSDSKVQDTSKSAKVSNTVINPAINIKTLTLTLGKSASLKVTGGTGKVDWSVGDKTIITVLNGKVSAKKRGTTYVYAKVNEITLRTKVIVK